MKFARFAASIILLFSLCGNIHSDEETQKRQTVIPPAEKNQEQTTKFKNPITFTFLNEHNEPIEGVFCLHEYKDGKFVRQCYQYKPLDEKGSITIEAFPTEFQFGASSKDKFYYYWEKSSNLTTTERQFIYRIKPTGAMKFEISSFPKDDNNPFDTSSLVVEYHKKTKEGTYEEVRGIGIMSNDKQQHVIGDLQPGEYFIAIKFNYEDPKPIYKSQDFKIALKEYTELPKIVITKEDIENSKR